MSESTFNFDTPVARLGTRALKYDGCRSVFGTMDVNPLWVADMDFSAPPAVTQALVERALHPVYGYTMVPVSVYESLVLWMDSRHGWKIDPESVLMAPGVVPSLNATVLALSEPGDGVIVQPPVYFPFFTAAANSGRRMIKNPLRRVGNRYIIDFDHLERCAREAKLLILCSPHNPVGRVWSPEELRKVLEIANDHRLTILSDEIHSDLIYPGKRHHSLSTLTDEPAGIVTTVAPSKTFNIPGLGLSALIVPDAEKRKAIREAFEKLHVSVSNPFSLVAFEAAYSDGGPWLDALMEYLSGTRDAVREYLTEHLSKITMVEPEGTYLIWLDFSGLGMPDAQLHRFLVDEAKIGLSPGTLFGQGGTGHMRLNIGAPRSQVMAALESLRRAIDRTTP